MGHGLARVTCLLLLVVATSPVRAQRPTFEIGFDWLFSLSQVDGGDNVFEVAIPLGGLYSGPQPVGPMRVGFFVSDRVSIEPSVSFNVLDRGDESYSRVGVAGHVLVHTSTDRTRVQPFVGVGGSFTSFSDEEETTSRNGVSALAGIKFPFVERLAIRLSGGTAYFAEDDGEPARWMYFLTAGFSLFDR